MDNIRSQTVGVVSDPTIISYVLIGLTSIILGYHTLYDGSSKSEISKEGDSSETKEEPSPEESKESMLPNLFGGPTEEKKGEEGGLFSSLTESKEPGPTESKEPGLFETKEEEKKTGGKKRKTRRDRKQKRKATRQAKKKR